MGYLKMLVIRIFGLLILTIVFLPALGQESLVSQMQRNLDRISVEQDELYKSSFNKVLTYTKENGLPVISYDDKGNIIQMVDIDVYGQPVYRTTFNAGAAITTGVVKLRQGGGLGLNLEGSGITLGIWDGGPVYDHSEFDTRVVFKENSGVVSDHGTHVAGTMLGAGVNSLAKGMAPKASLRSYFWDNDINEMALAADPTQSSLLISNHSYGLLQGWNCTSTTSCTWFGTPSISTVEDWRFGFYTNAAKNLDEVAFNAPYYLIFWAAGNDRDDINFPNTGGPNPAPADGNAGTGFDSMGQEGTAKNILTIGAISKITDYTSSSSVEVAGFSNWGPTDDGRIKPDLVAAGVSIFSSVSTPSGQIGSRYNTLNGTSMATPNAAGSLALLQELNKNLTGNFLRSATLKALAIHTAKEAGPGPGPDYMHGWGLVDVEAGAKLLLAKDDQNVFVKELELNNGEVFEITLNPKSGTKISATIVWTDPAGVSPPNSLDPTNLMLVNDLDMRLVDDAGNRQFPWTLNPDLGSLSTAQIAQKGDNFRDNVEKIEFENPEPRSYKLVVSHKRSLAGGRQRFSLILSHTSDGASGVSYFWVGNSGDFNDPQRWSLTSGGSSAGVIPGPSDRVIIDENSFSGSGVINISSSATIKSFTWLARKSVLLNLNDNTLSIEADLTVTNDFLAIGTTGKIKFLAESKDDNQIVLKNNDFSKANFEMATVRPTAKWKLQGSPKIAAIDLVSGSLDISSNSLVVTRLMSNSVAERTLNLSKSKISGVASSSLASQSLTLVTDKLSEVALLEGSDGLLDWANIKFLGTIKTNKSRLIINGNNEISQLKIDGLVELIGDNKIDSLSAIAGSEIRLAAGSRQTLTRFVSITGSQTARTSLSTSGSIKGILRFIERNKLCFDFLNVSNIAVEGDVVVNAGIQSTLINSAQFLQEDCSSVLFPDFEVKYNCENSLVEFMDKSAGAISGWRWVFDDPNVSAFDVNTNKPRAVFSKVGSVSVSQTISNSNSSRTYTKVIQLKSNILPANTVFISGNNLVSTQSGQSYQWLNAMVPIVGATSRLYQFDGKPGLYNVLMLDQVCNRLSSTMLISSVSKDPSFDKTDTFYPNPSTGLVYFNTETPLHVKVLNTVGVVNKEFTVDSQNSFIDLHQMPRGLYILVITSSTGVASNRLVLVD